MTSSGTLYLLLPEVILVLFATAIYVGGAFTAAREGWAWMAAAGLLLAGLALHQQQDSLHLAAQESSAASPMGMMIGEGKNAGGEMAGSNMAGSNRAGQDMAGQNMSGPMKSIPRENPAADPLAPASDGDLLASRHCRAARDFEWSGRDRFLRACRAVVHHRRWAVAGAHARARPRPGSRRSSWARCS